MNRGWIAAVWLLGAQLGTAAPVRPVDPALELARNLPSYRETLQAVPRDLDAAVGEAQSLIGEGRKRADIRAFAYAERIVEPFRAQTDRHPALALVFADIRQYRHDFAGAAEILDRVLARNPRDVQARLMRAQVSLAQGRGRDGLRDCMSLAGHEEAWIWGACAAQAYAVQGRLADARRLLDINLRGTALTGAQAAWVDGIEAQLSSQSGDRAGAEQWLRKALAADPDDHVAAIELMDLWNADGRQGSTLQLLRDRPASDAYLIREAQALRASNPGGVDAPRCASLLSELRRRFGEADALGDRTHLRERALFELEFGDARAALAHARENYRTQRELTDLRLLLRAAVITGDRSAASDAVQWLSTTRAEDAASAELLRRLRTST